MPKQDDGGIWLITGAMAVGKSTAAQLLAERLERSVHLRGDAFRRMVVNGRAAPNTDDWERERRMRYSIGALAADAYSSHGYTVVWQDCLIGPMLGEVEQWVKTRPLRIVMLTARANVIAHRDAHRHKRGYDGDWTVADLEQIIRNETPPIGQWIDNSDLTPSETIAAILG